MKRLLGNNIPGVIIIEGHTQGLSNTRSLGEFGIPVIIIDKTNCIARYSKYCCKFFICPDFAGDDFADFLIELSIRENVKGWSLIPSNDHAIHTISRNKKRLESYFKFLIPSIDIINNILDKSRLLSVAQLNNIPIPVTQYFNGIDDNLDEKMTFPLITKGRIGLSFYKTFGRKAFIANNRNELKEQLEFISQRFKINETFTQELIPFNGTNKTLSFTAFCIGGEIKTYWMGVKLREHPWRFGTATLAESIKVPECFDKSASLLNALNYSGICEIEYLYDYRVKQYKLIEINARTWLWVGLAKECGIDFAKLLYLYLNHKETIFPKDYQIGLKWINRLTDTYISLVALLKGQLKISEYFASLRGAKVNAIFSLNDLKPSIMLIFLGLSLARKRKFWT